MTTRKGQQPMQADTAFLAVQERAAHFTRQLGPHASKRLQTDFAAAGMDLEPWTAERVLMGRGSLPTILRLLKVYGWRAASFVLEPVCGQVDKLELAHRIEQTERLAREAIQEAHELRQEIAAQAGGTLQPHRGERDLVRHVVSEDRPQADAVAAQRRKVPAR